MREYITISQLISTACDLQGGCWSIHFEYIFSVCKKQKLCIVVMRKQKLRLPY